MTDYNKLDKKILQAITENEHLFTRIKIMIQKEIKNMKIITEIYAEKHNYDDEKMIYSIFFIPQKQGNDILLGEIKFPEDPKATLNTLIDSPTEGVSIRELMMCMAQFTFAYGLPNNGEEKKYIPRGTMIMLDVVFNIEYYLEKVKEKQGGLNIRALQKKKEELVTFFGYDIDTIKIFTDEMIKRSNDTQFSIGHLLLFTEMSRTRWLSSYNLPGSLPAELRGVVHADPKKTEECNMGQKTRQEAYIEELSNIEEFSTRERELMGERTGLTGFSLGRCKYELNDNVKIKTSEGLVETGLEAVDLKFRKNTNIVGMISGHTLIMLATANLHIPNMWKNKNNSFTLEKLKERYHLFILGLIIWMVPSAHSIWEILLAAKSSEMMFYGGWFRAFDFSIKNELLDEINILIQSLGYSKINIEFSEIQQNGGIYRKKYIENKYMYNII